MLSARPLPHNQPEDPMGYMSKNKGKRGEQNFAEFLNNTLGITDPLAKIKSMHHDQGADQLHVQGLAIEIKRQEILLVDKWWDQACIQADKYGLLPVLAYRQNRKKWSVCIPAYLLCLQFKGYVTLTEDVFQQWLLEWVKGGKS